MGKKGNNAAVAWRGPSLVDGAPVRVIVAALSVSKNRKTGDMIHVSFCRDDIAPTAAIKVGDDESVCGTCVHRPSNDGSCYVPIYPTIDAPWHATNATDTDEDCATRAIRKANRPVRIGAYGNPSVAPFAVGALMARAAEDSHGRARHTGYIHDWRTADPRWSTLVMASVDSEEERADASAMGYRTFRVKLPEQPVSDGEIVCPASEEAGKRTTCARCLLCSGSSGRGSVDIVIDAHSQPWKVSRIRARRLEGRVVRDEQDRLLAIIRTCGKTFTRSDVRDAGAEAGFTPPVLRDAWKGLANAGRIARHSGRTTRTVWEVSP